MITKGATLGLNGSLALLGGLGVEKAQQRTGPSPSYASVLRRGGRGAEEELESIQALTNEVGNPLH